MGASQKAKIPIFRTGSILDMFSNAACYAAFADMGKLAKSFGEQKLADDYQSWTENLAAGIETHLYDPEQGIYSAAITLANESVGNFVFSPAVDNSFAAGAPIVAVDKTCGSKLSVLKVFLNMLGRMIARRNILVAAKRTDIEVNVKGFVDLFWITAEPSRMTDRRTAFLEIFSRFFLLIFFERCLERFGKIIVKLSIGVLKLLDAFQKFFNLVVGEIHAELKRIDSFAQIVAFDKNRFRSFAIEENTEISERTIRAFDLFVTIIWFAMPHGVSSGELTTNRRPTASIARIAIKVNNFFSVNEIFPKNNNNLTMEAL